MTEEGRRTPRIETDATLDYIGANVLLEHRIENLSYGGLSLCCGSPEPVGTLVDLTINFPDFQESIAVEAKVAWVKTEDKRSMGLSFVGLSAEHKGILDRYLLERAARFTS